MRRGRGLLVVAALAAALAPACGGPKDDPILSLSAEESLAAGKELMARKKWGQAREYLTHAFEVEPNSRSGREALLLAADTLYLEGGSGNFIKAEAKYRDFQNRFPTSDQGDYVQFQLANSLLQRMEPADRDQSTTRKALAAFEDLLNLFPTSVYLPAAREALGQVRANLAEHEMQVGTFYMRFRLPQAAAVRLESLVEGYPDYPQIDRALYLLAVSYQRNRQADAAAAAVARLRAEHPESALLSELPALEERIRALAAAASRPPKEGGEGAPRPAPEALPVGGGP